MRSDEICISALETIKEESLPDKFSIEIKAINFRHTPKDILAKRKAEFMRVKDKLLSMGYTCFSMWDSSGDKFVIHFSRKNECAIMSQ